MSSIGVDTGGTFTDLVYLNELGELKIAKKPSTPQNFSQGVLDVVSALASSETILSKLDHFYHGTTVATNAMITGSGAKIGFITTMGHRDVLPIMRIIGRSAGKSETELKQYSYSSKPSPIVEKSLIKEVDERIDSKGRVVVPINPDSVHTAISELLQEKVEAIGVCLLWSFKNKTHEKFIKEMIKEMAPNIHVSVSCEIAPAMKEYERSATTAVNAHVAPLLTTYLSDLQNKLKEKGLKSPLYVMQSMGGSMHAKDADKRSVNTLASGPAGGVVAAKFLGQLLGHKNIICADVGGTSFDVGLVVDGEPIVSSTSDISQYTLLAPTIDIVSIGAGGGSIGWVDLGRLKVGPQSAGAVPGPACYGNGGSSPTVTDADVVLGYIDPNYFLGGDFKLDKDLAEEAIKTQIAEPLSMSVVEAASGIVEIANHHMSDLIRKMTIERGYDPRDFVIYGFGGAGPVHAGAFGRELGVKEVLFPLGNVASAFSALGLAVSDLSTVTQISDLSLAPFSSQDFENNFSQIENEALENLGIKKESRAKTQITRIAELRYKGQVHQVDTPVPNGTLDANAIAEVLNEFERRYELLYGKGAGFREAGIELVTYRVIASTGMRSITIKKEKEKNKDSGSALVGSDRIYWRELGKFQDTKIYGSKLEPHMELSGPAIIRFESTTALVHPGQKASVDGFGNVRLKEIERQ